MTNDGLFVKLRHWATARWSATPAPTRIAGLMLVVIAWLAVRHALTFRGTEIDDAYITFRHAENLARGHGPVFNVGERVEGSSSFLSVVLLAAGYRIGVTPMTASLWLGMAALVALVITTFASVRMLVGRRGGDWLGLLSAACVASSTTLAYYAASGMETTLYAALALLGLALFLTVQRESARKWWPIVFGLAAWTRPEGSWFFLLTWGLLTLQLVGKESWEIALRKSASALAWFAIVFGPLLVFRRLYYGAWIPNSVLAKSGGMDAILAMPAAVAVSTLWKGAGVVAAKAFLNRFGPLLFVLPLGLLNRRLRTATAPLLAFVAACMAVVVWNEADWFPYDRLLAPAVAPCALLGALGLRAVLYQPDQDTRLGHWPSVLACSFAFWWAADDLRYERDYKYQYAKVVEYMKWTGRTLRSVAREDDLFATDMAGIIPYFARVRTLDTFGLCDAHIARFGKRAAPMGKQDFPYVYRQRPTFYLYNFVATAKVMHQDPAFREWRNDYWAVVSERYLELRGNSGNTGKLLLVRKDRPELERLQEAFQAKLVEPEVEFRRLGLLP